MRGWTAEQEAEHEALEAARDLPYDLPYGRFELDYREDDVNLFNEAEYRREEAELAEPPDIDVYWPEGQ